VARHRSYRQPRLVQALAISAVIQGVAAAAYEAQRPIPLPVLTLSIGGDGEGTVQVYVDGKPEPALRCDGTEACRLELRRGTQVHFVAVRGEKSTFAGWAQLPMRTPEKLRRVAGDPMADCLDVALDPTNLDDVMACDAVVRGDLEVGAVFGLVPDEVDVAWVETPMIDDVILPPTEPPTPKKPVAPIDAEKLEDQAVEVAIIPDMPKPIELQPPKPPPPPPEQTPPPPAPKPQMPESNMTMVEVPDQNEVEKAPDDATHLSDKNRDVVEETRAKETNLDKESEGTAVASIESNDRTSPEIGGPEDKIRQLEDSQATADQNLSETDHSGEDEAAKGLITGEEGDEGDEGSGDKTPLLGMRDIAGRGSIVEQGDGKKKGDKGKKGVKTQLEFKDYERIVGRDKADLERQVAMRSMTAKKGRWEKKLEAIKSSLENFTPDVKPGNQTALKTRANPFAVYVARMHRKIHELWGFGYLEGLDDKAADHELNNFDLWTNIEVSINPNGTLHKTTIVHNSGKLEFDVAALDTVMSAAPYEETPEAIRSVDGRVYLRWGFYRNWRQCGTFNVEPYILDSIPGGIEPLDEDSAAVAAKPMQGTKAVTPDSGSDTDKPSPTSSVKDDKALYAANLWVSGYSTGQVDKIVRFSATPFKIGDGVAETTKDLTTMMTGLVVEAGKLKEFKLVTGDEYAKKFGTPVELGDDGAILVVTTEKTTFAVVLQKMRSGDYRATQLVR
jgi:outer membrane biosynthesis protein TonB